MFLMGPLGKEFLPAAKMLRWMLHDRQHRGIPFGWQCLDCSFGVFGIVPLLLIDRWTRLLEKTIIEGQGLPR